MITAIVIDDEKNATDVLQMQLEVLFILVKMMTEK